MAIKEHTYDPHPGDPDYDVRWLTSEVPTRLPSLWTVSGVPNPQALRYYRTLHGMSFSMMAAFMGVDLRTYKGWERGEAIPQEQYAYALDLIVRYTASTMQEYNGILPPHEQLKWAIDVDRETGDWYMPPLENERLIEAMALRDEKVRELRTENRELRTRILELEEDLAYWRRKEIRSQRREKGLLGKINMEE